MRVKVFHIRLSTENLQTDIDNLNAFMSSVTLKKTAAQLVGGPTNFWSVLIFYDNLDADKTGRSSSKIAVKSVSELTEDENRVYGFLKQWRADKADELNVPRFMVLHNSVLMSVAKAKPKTPDDLLKIKGFGDRKISKYGEDIIALLNSI